MDDDDASVAVTVGEILSDAFKPLQEIPVSGFGSEIRAQPLPSCRMETKVTSSFDKYSAYPGVNLESQKYGRGLFENGGNFAVQSSRNKELTLFRNPDCSGFCHGRDASIRNLRLGESVSQIDEEDHLELNSGDGTNTCRDETDSAYSSADNSSQVVDDFGQNVHSSCSRCKNCGHVVGSVTKSNSITQSYEAENQDSSRIIGGMPRLFESGFSGADEDVGEDMPDLVQPSSPTKRKDLEDERPNKRMKSGVSDDDRKEPAISSASHPPVDIHGHGNIALVGNDNLTINIIQSNTRNGDTVNECWSWSGTCQKEIEVENVSGVFRRIADGLAPHVDYRRVARHLEFPKMATLEDDLSMLSRKKCSAADKIFFVLLRWWKSNKFGNNQADIKTEIGYLLEDLNLRRMKNNLKQYFD